MNDESVYGVLENIMLLSYTATGPGYYLQVSGAFDGLI